MADHARTADHAQQASHAQQADHGRALPLDPNRFDLLTFDCYGTLVDWEGGIVAALRPVCDAHGCSPSDADLLAGFARFEHLVQQGGRFRRYREVLGDTLARIGESMGFRATAEEQAAFGASPGEWPAFPDTVDALRRLAKRYKLGIVSNVDDDLFAKTRREQLRTEFDWIVTAEQVGGYKPATGHFEEMAARSGIPPKRTLHIAQSLFHDIAPAASLGYATLWVNRRSRVPGSGATPPAAARPSAEVPDMATAADLLTGGS